MFSGLSAFPLTPISHDEVHAEAFIGIIKNLVQAQVDSITVLGSTGSFAYLSQKERAYVTELAIEHAHGTPIIVGVGALRTFEVLENITLAEEAGAQAVTLTPMTYQPLTETEVFQLFATAAEHSHLPLVVYENPTTTRFKFSLDLYERIGQLPNIASFKIPPLPNDLDQAKSVVTGIREVIPAGITIGISGDSSAVLGFQAGCDTWYSVIGGTLPRLASNLTRMAQHHQWSQALAETQRLAPLWELYGTMGGSVRVVAAIAEHLDWVPRPSLPLPLGELSAEQRTEVAEVINRLELEENS